MRRRTIKDVPGVTDACAIGGSGKSSVDPELERPSAPKPRTQLATGPPTLRLALSIREFCAAHGISQGLYFKLKRQGVGPRELKAGTRTIISIEAAAEWRR